MTPPAEIEKNKNWFWEKNIAFHLRQNLKTDDQIFKKKCLAENCWYNITVKEGAGPERVIYHFHLCSGYGIKMDETSQEKEYIKKDKQSTWMEL